MSDHSAGGTERFVIFILDDGWPVTHGGPYPPTDAREIRDAMRKHKDNGNYNSWNIPENTEYIGSVTRPIHSLIKDEYYRNGHTLQPDTDRSDSKQ